MKVAGMRSRLTDKQGTQDRLCSPPLLGKAGSLVLYLMFLVLGLGACSSEYQEVKIVVDDFRFSPARVDVQAGQPVHLLVRNQGRELHRFHSALFAHPRVDVVADAGKPADSVEHGFPLAPGQRLELVLTLPPGVYHFRCPIKGHRGMRGMIVVQTPARA